MDQKMNVLLADDDFNTRELLGAILNNMGYNVTYARSGEEALKIIEEREIIEESDFGAILLDIMMPGMDGAEAARTLKNYLKKRIPIIAVTARQLDYSLLVSLGINELIPKPVCANKLSEAIKRVTRAAMTSRIACA